MSDSLQSTGRAWSGTEHSPFSRALKDAHPCGSGACHFLPLADALQVLIKHTIDASYEYCLKHLGLDHGVIFSFYTFQGTNNVLNYEVDQRKDVSVQDVLEAQEPPIPLPWLARGWNKAERTNLPTCHTMHQISQKGQDCSTWLQVTGKGDEHKEQTHKKQCLADLDCPRQSPLPQCRCSTWHAARSS